MKLYNLDPKYYENVEKGQEDPSSSIVSVNRVKNDKDRDEEYDELGPVYWSMKKRWGPRRVKSYDVWLAERNKSMLEAAHNNDAYASVAPWMGIENAQKELYRLTENAFVFLNVALNPLCFSGTRMCVNVTHDGWLKDVSYVIFELLTSVTGIPFDSSNAVLKKDGKELFELLEKSGLKAFAKPTLITVSSEIIYDAYLIRKMGEKIFVPVSLPPKYAKYDPTSFQTYKDYSKCVLKSFWEKMKIQINEAKPDELKSIRGYEAANAFCISQVNEAMKECLPEGFSSIKEFCSAFDVCYKKLYDDFVDICTRLFWEMLKTNETLMRSIIEAETDMKEQKKRLEMYDKALNKVTPLRIAYGETGENVDDDGEKDQRWKQTQNDALSNDTERKTLMLLYRNAEGKMEEYERRIEEKPIAIEKMFYDHFYRSFEKTHGELARCFETKKIESNHSQSDTKNILPRHRSTLLTQKVFKLPVTNEGVLSAMDRGQVLLKKIDGSSIEPTTTVLSKKKQPAKLYHKQLTRKELLAAMRRTREYLDSTVNVPKSFPKIKTPEEAQNMMKDTDEYLTLLETKKPNMPKTKKQKAKNTFKNETGASETYLYASPNVARFEAKHRKLRNAYAQGEPTAHRIVDPKTYDAMWGLALSVQSAVRMNIKKRLEKYVAPTTKEQEEPDRTVVIDDYKPNPQKTFPGVTVQKTKYDTQRRDIYRTPSANTSVVANQLQTRPDDDNNFNKRKQPPPPPLLKQIPSFGTNVECKHEAPKERDFERQKNVSIPDSFRTWILSKWNAYKDGIDVSPEVLYTDFKSAMNLSTGSDSKIEILVFYSSENATYKMAVDFTLKEVRTVKMLYESKPKNGDENVRVDSVKRPENGIDILFISKPSEEKGVLRVRYGKKTIVEAKCDVLRLQSGGDRTKWAVTFLKISGDDRELILQYLDGLNPTDVYEQLNR
jgi:hypothetical protein